jgi:hypothetical protein
MESQSTTKPQEKSEPKLVDIEVSNENVALNLLVNFVHMAQRRGAFNIDESAKIYECIKKFQKPM